MGGGGGGRGGELGKKWIEMGGGVQKCMVSGYLSDKSYYMYMIKQSGIPTLTSKMLGCEIPHPYPPDTLKILPTPLIIIDSVK